MKDDAPQVPDYVAACDFLRFVSLLPAFIGGTIIAKSIVGGFVALFVSMLAWHCAARAMERRCGEAGRSLANVAYAIVGGWLPLLAVCFAADAMTHSYAATIFIAALLRFTVAAAKDVSGQIERALRGVGPG